MKSNTNLVNWIPMVIFAIITLIFTVVSSACSTSSGINGKVKDAVTGSPLESVNVRILNSGFQSKSTKAGEFSISYAPGNLTVIFECVGYMPKAVTLALTSGGTYPMGEISLFPFPILVDMYLRPIGDVELTVQQSTYGGSGVILQKTRSNSKGQFGRVGSSF